MTADNINTPTGGSSVQTRPRAWWVWAVAGGYGLLVAGMLAVPWVEFDASDLRDLWPWILIATTVWLLAAGGLMFVPIRLGRLRPMTRRSIWIPLLTSGLLAGLLVFGSGLALMELWRLPEWVEAGIVAVSTSVWACWAGLFYLVSRRRGNTPTGLALYKWLIAGSVLELLVAVPSHLVVRKRTDCCAGMFTGTAIALGVVVLLAALGPGVVLLYVARCKRIQVPQTDREHGFEVTNPRHQPGTAKN